ncbi:zinc finger protein GAI-ASSOCIATED FACTOR 1-like [Arachis stenosperma]|uniref:zinc finger protein GAI-ASSOCIATED FACTOR 1-like n=1 Tax=Arachis stenosperma TaxID=217475 RepID=UPI0025AC3D60|nr:zinc finger protein GAI-ASSOCIATED FACTOR 1-like [Arachis stenosperma]
MSNNMSGNEDGSFSSGNTGEEEVHQENKQQQQQTNKKKRNLPGTPDPSAEVVALSPTTLMATNRFVCEICNKGFQRDQNLQLHRRGHNLPWKLRQRTTTEVKKRVYVCPEPTCVHHNPSRALGDLTGIKKHFSRKHGEKKWKCDKCSKRYAVQSDWKAHLKTCGTREYKCDCGTIFSRRDSFITHRAFCDALTEENNKLSSTHQGLLTTGMPPSQIPLTTSSSSSDQLFITDPPLIIPSTTPFNNSIFSSTTTSSSCSSSTLQLSSSGFNNVILSNPSSSSSPHMSATALLQKAAQMGATASNNSMNYSPMMQKSFSMGTTTMAGVVSGGHDAAFTNQLFQKEIVSSQLFDANTTTNSSSNNDMGMYGQIFMGTITSNNNNNNGLMKISSDVEQEISDDDNNNNNNTIMVEASRFGGGSGRDDDIATVHDFLGIGGASSIASTATVSLHESEKQQRLVAETLNQQRLQIMNHFHHHIPHHAADSAIDKTMWDV